MLLMKTDLVKLLKFFLTFQRSDGRFVLAGITSWGVGCGEFGYYTRVSKFIDWIKYEIGWDSSH